MNSAQREKLAIVILPTAIIAVVWGMWLRPSAKLAELDQSLTDLRVQAPSAAVLAAEQARLTQLNQDRADLTTEQTQLLDQWHKLRHDRQRGPGQAAAIHDVCDVFRRHGLTLLREQRSSAGQESDATEPLRRVFERLAKPPQQLIPELASVAAKPGPAAPVPLGALPPPDAEPAAMPNAVVPPLTLWQIEFAGRYADVQAALEELATGPAATLPVQLTMDKAKPELSLRRWTLVVCL